MALKREGEQKDAEKLPYVEVLRPAARRDRDLPAGKVRSRVRAVQPRDVSRSLLRGRRSFLAR